MNGWNRIFVVLAAGWALGAPLLLVSENNKLPEMSYSRCSDVAYQLYGSSSSRQLDMDKYRAERDKCYERLVPALISVPGIFGAMVGAGDWKLGGMAWGFIVMPLAMLWIVAWGVGRTLSWIVAGFRR